MATLADSVKLLDFFGFGDQVTNHTKVVSVSVTDQAGHDYNFAKVGRVLNERYSLNKSCCYGPTFSLTSE